MCYFETSLCSIATISYFCAFLIYYARFITYYLRLSKPLTSLPVFETFSVYADTIYPQIIYILIFDFDVISSMKSRIASLAL